MKKDFQTEVIKSLKDINRNLEIINKSKVSSINSFTKGLLEWSEEDKKFFKINHEKNKHFENLLFLENHKNTLINNTKNFLCGKPANSILLWGARGTGKSSLILSIYNSLIKKFTFSMIEIKFFQINFLPKILRFI